MAKLKLNPNPTFSAKVGIPVPGAAPALVEFTFKHKAKADLLAWASTERNEVEAILDIVAGWELDDAFTAENVERLLQNYLGAGAAIVSTYRAELTGAREKN